MVETVPIEEFKSLIQPLLGLPVSWSWKGRGSTIFLEPVIIFMTYPPE
jgi:hypothetical protein